MPVKKPITFKPFYTQVQLGTNLRETFALSDEEIIEKAFNNQQPYRPKVKREQVENITVSVDVSHYHECTESYYGERMDECSISFVATVNGEIPLTEAEIEANRVTAEKAKAARAKAKEKAAKAQKAAKAKEIEQLKKRIAKDPELKAALGEVFHGDTG